jgi:predicted dehydrogenase
MNKIGIGAVGVGGHGKWITQAVTKCNNLKLVACYDINKTESKNIAREFKCLHTESLEKLLAIPNIKGVTITVPNYLHADYVIATANAGKACFVEKPIANTISDAERMIKECRKNKVILAVGHNFRRRAEFRKAKELLKAKALGEIISIEGNFSRPGALTLPKKDWRRDEKKCPMPTMMQLGIHMIDSFIYLLGPIKKVSAIESTHGNNVSAILQFKNGIIGNISSNYFSKEYWYVNIYGTRASLYIDGTRFMLENALSKREYKLNQINTLQEEINEFADALSGKTKFEVDGYSALESLKVVRAMIASAKSKKAATIN